MNETAIILCQAAVPFAACAAWRTKGAGAFLFRRAARRNSGNRSFGLAFTRLFAKNLREMRVFMNGPKRVLCLHDLACIGRCSLSVAVPVLSAMGIQACPLPVALLSTHTGGFGTPACAQQTGFCNDALRHFAAQEIAFDAVYSGYLSHPSQADTVRQALRQNPGALALIDPVMGDGGKAYSAVTPALCSAMLQLCQQADYLVPNVTESALLLGLTPCDAPLQDDQLVVRCRELAACFPRAKGIVLTGVQHADGRWGNVCCEAQTNFAPQFLPFVHTPQHYPGTGDLFASVLLGALLRQNALPQAVQAAAAFTGQAVAATHTAGTPPRFGVHFEPLLGNLAACTLPL